MKMKRENLTRENPWNEFEFTDMGENYAGRWRWAPPIIYTIKFEFLHVPTNTIRLEAGYERADHETNKFRWKYVYSEGEDKSIWYDVSEVRWRYADKDYQRLCDVVDILQVGDFVKCIGTKSNDWNKVQTIKEWTIFGQKYTRPEEGYERFTASENSLTKIRQIVRNGKKIYPSK